MDAGNQGRPLVLVAWVGVLAFVVWTVSHLGDGPLASPPLGDVADLHDWYEQRLPHEAVFAVMRLAVLMAGWYLLAVTAVGVLARVGRAARLVRVCDRLTIPPVRHILHVGIGIGLAVTTVAAHSGPVAASESIAQAEHEPIELDATLPPALALPVMPQNGPGTATSAASGFALPAMDVHDEDHVSAGHSAADSTAHSAPARRVHVIEPGEHLWGVAESSVTDATGIQEPDDADVARYWRVLVDYNRGRLPDPDNPDLVHPGLEITLPHFSR